MSPHPFPDDFTWGVATSAFQIEGATLEGGRGRSIWDTFCATPGKVEGGANADVACDHYHLWPQDLDLMRSLGLDAYRFSIAWPRVQPSGRGPANAAGLDFYERLVDGMLQRGLAPHATLYHWDLPQALEDLGGWRNRDTAYAFAEYAALVAERLGDRVTSYATLNEPWCSAYLGYGAGNHAPGVRDWRAHLQAAHHLLLAHGLAMPELRRFAPATEAGIVLNLYPSYPGSDDPEDVAAAHLYDGFFNRWYLDPLFHGRYPDDMWQGYGADAPKVHDGDLAIIAAPNDFLGVNYYSRAVLVHAPQSPYPHVDHLPVEGERTAMDWEVYPKGLTDLLLRLHRDYAPPKLYITENGAAYPDIPGPTGMVNDQARLSYIKRHIEAVAEACAGGAPVKGYFAWSFMDNFEWAYGYTQRFGIVHVSYGTQQRQPKASALWYADFIRQQRAVAVEV